MGREVRRVPAGWRHPKDGAGRFIPLFGGSVSAKIREYKEEARQWALGYRRSWAKDRMEFVPRDASTEDLSFEDWAGEVPKPEEHMPDWPEAERTHYQMYETCSEGTPISPVLETPEALARWLADTWASAFGSMTATYEEWLAMIQGPGSSASAGIIGGVLVTGVAMAAGRPTEKSAQ